MKSQFRVDWIDLKATALRLLANDHSDFKLKRNADAAKDFLQGGKWAGFTSGQLERWLREGYKSSVIHGLEDFIPPIREKRKLRFNEEGDEFHFDIAASGGENYMSHWTKRNEIPGLSIQADIGLQANVSAEILTAYHSWICQIAYTLDSAGIDTDISLTCNTVSGTFEGAHSIPADTLVRVKEENEALDFLSWSAMLSPASLRGLMFAAMAMHADSIGKVLTAGVGMQSKPGWKVNFDSATRVLQITSPFSAHNFPETDMTSQFRNALKTAK